MKQVPANQTTTFKNDKTEMGWKLLENVEINVTEPIKYIGCLRKNESIISGQEIIRRAKQVGNAAGQYHAESLLERQDDIPINMRKYYLLFTGTIWQTEPGYVVIPYLNCLVDRWFLMFTGLGPDFNKRSRSAHII